MVEVKNVGAKGFEPLTPWVETKCSEPTELRALAVANIVSFFEHQRDLYRFCNEK